jgi:hypothetical protein
MARCSWALALVPACVVAAVALAAPRAGQHAASGDPVGKNGVFLLERLPQGKSVTIPRPATTYVPLSARVTLTATDIPQTVSFRAINQRAGSARAFRISIFDPQQDRVKYVDLAPGTPFLYNFKELASITVVPEATSGAPEGTTLMVESDKPLEIAR